MSGPTVLYIVHCIFCGRPHESAFFDEVEERILACRDAAPASKRGDLQAWDGYEPTMRVEAEASIRDAHAEAAAISASAEGE